MAGCLNAVVVFITAVASASLLAQLAIWVTGGDPPPLLLVLAIFLGVKYGMRLGLVVLGWIHLALGLTPDENSETCR